MFEITFLATRLLNPMHVKHSIPYHICIYNRLPEEETLSSKYVEVIVNENVILENAHFVVLYCAVIL